MRSSSQFVSQVNYDSHTCWKNDVPRLFVKTSILASSATCQKHRNISTACKPFLAFPWFSWDFISTMYHQPPNLHNSHNRPNSQPGHVNPLWGTQNSDASELQLVHLPAVPAKHSRQLEWQSCVFWKANGIKQRAFPGLVSGLIYHRNMPFETNVKWIDRYWFCSVKNHRTFSYHFS